MTAAQAGSGAQSAAQQALRDGDTAKAVKLLQDEVRAKPADAKLRIFLFQLLCVQGQWDRALNQLTVAAEMDAAALPMAQTYRECIQCERLREEVFLGHKAPLLFGQPDTWLALLIEALLREGRGELADAAKLREQAFEQAPATPGSIDGKAFEWIADADMRLGPVLEAVVNGKYYWVPFSRLTQVTIEEPKDLRDRVWTPSTLQFSNGGEVVALLPTRYAGTSLADAQLALARRTDWVERTPGLFVGQGQRMLTTNEGDFALMDARSIALNPPPEPSSEAPDDESSED